MAPDLRALGALPENPHNGSHLKFQFQGIRYSILASAGTRHTSRAQSYMQAKHQNIQNHVFDPTAILKLRRLRQNCHKFKASLGYRVSARPARAICETLYQNKIKYILPSKYTDSLAGFVDHISVAVQWHLFTPLRLPPRHIGWTVTSYGHCEVRAYLRQLAVWDLNTDRSFFSLVVLSSKVLPCW